MRIALLLAHSIEEWHQVRLMHELGHEVFSIGAYIDPAHPGDDKRPPLPDVPFLEDLAKAVWSTPTPADNPDTLWAAKATLPDAVIDWADVFIVHHREWEWVVSNWPRIRHKRVIWRTVGQSLHDNESIMRELRPEGLQIVRYSPNERVIPYYAGEDALIRFWADPDELNGWTGEDAIVANVTQDMRGRGSWTGWDFWVEATQGLPAYPAGPKSEQWGGAGSLSYPGLIDYLRRARVYCYTGTFPASYTLGLIEAMMVGVPVLAAGPHRWNAFAHAPYAPKLYEAHELATGWSDSPMHIARAARDLLEDRDLAAEWSTRTREAAIATFGLPRIREQWRRFLEG